MPVFNFELLRTYSTIFEIEAETQEKAYKTFQSLGSEMYAQELEQCNIIKELVLGDKYARKCTCCDKGMNEGYFATYEYFCSDNCLRNEISATEWEELVNEDNDNYYWTEWEDTEDYQYQIINGILEEIN